MKTTIRTLVCLFIVLRSALSYSQDYMTEPDTSSLLFDMSLEELMNVRVVTVSKTEEKQSNAPGVISILTKDEIARFGGSSLADLLARVPGIVPSTVYLTDRTILSSRGAQITANSNHVLLLINGKPVRESLEGGISSEMYESFPTNIIERIEVIKGPGSVLYGSNAFAGVINVITEKPTKTDASIAGHSGSEGAYGSLVDLKIKKGDLNVVAAGNYRKDPTWNVDFNQMVGTSRYMKRVEIPDKGIGSFLNASYKNISGMSSYNEWNNFGAGSRGSGNAYWKKFFNSITYDAKISDKWQSVMSVVHTQSKFDTDSFPQNHRNSYELVTEWTNFIQVSEKSKIVVGGLYIRTKGEEYNTISGTKNVSTDAHRNSYGGYIQADYKLYSKLKVIGGVQANKIENIPIGVVPRIGMIVEPMDKAYIKILYGQAFRAPSLNEVSLDAPTLKGNSSLKPEKVANLDISIGYTNQYFQCNLSGFYSSLTDIVKQNKTETNVPGFYDNLGEATIKGGELESKIYPRKELLITVSVLYQQSEDKDGNKNITPTSNLTAKGGLSYVWANGITWSIFNRYQGKLDERFASTINPTPRDAYNIVDAHLNVDINQLAKLPFKPKINVFAHANNLLDKEVWLPMWGAAPGNSIPYNKGRLIYGGVLLLFK